MRTDNYGRQILTEDDLCHIYLQDPEQVVRNALVSSNIVFNPQLELANKPSFQVYQEFSLTLEQFDSHQQNKWFMPSEYLQFDIAKYVLDLCKTDHELQRVGQELLMFQEREMFPLLCYCKYLVDTMRDNGVVWGVGRGSSVSSYVLYLLGIHRINSLHYDLSIDEFLK